MLISPRYPGLRCDIPSAAYQFTFESNTQWSEFYAPGPEIQRYLQNVAKKYGVYQYCRFNHRFIEARWIEEDGVWELSFEDLLKNEVSCHFAADPGR